MGERCAGVDKNIKKAFHDNTVGVIVCKKEDKFVLEYCTNPNIFVTIYSLSQNNNKYK